MEIEEALKDPATEEEIPKSTFIVYFQGEQLKMRVKKICEGSVLVYSLHCFVDYLISQALNIYMQMIFVYSNS